MGRPRTRGLLGSLFYVGGLTAAEREQVALYLDFEMVGSPIYVHFVLDGGDSDGIGGPAGPAGSADTEAFFEAFHADRGVPFKGTDLTGRSDYGPFQSLGIPVGGLFDGADGIKTPDESAIWGGTAGE